MKRTTIITTTAATFATLFAFAGEAQADETQTTPFEPTYADRVTEFPWESAYFPSSGPLQVKLGASAWQDVEIGMTGDAQYSWDDGTMGVRGDADGGYFLNTIGADVTVTVAYDILGITGQVEIGVYEIDEGFNKDFTPYVLQGNADRPVQNAFSLGPVNLVDTPFTIGSGTGNFTLDFRIDSPGVTFAGTSVDLQAGADSLSSENQAQITQEQANVALTMPGEPGDRVDVSGTEYGTISSEVSIHFMPTVELSMFGLDFAIGPFDIEMAYPVLDGQEVQFDEITMQFDIPEAPPPSDGGSDDGGTGGEPDPQNNDDGAGSSSGDGGSDDGAQPPPMDDEDPMPMGDSDSAGEMDPMTSDGCSCTSGEAPNGLVFGLAALGLLGLLRRRD